MATDDAPLPTDSFLCTAIWLKEKVVEVTWKVENARCIDPTAYLGLLGTALMCLRSYEATGNLDDLRLSSQIVDKCACCIASTKYRRNVTFLCGSTGVYALGAVVAHYQDDHQKKKLFLDLFIELDSGLAGILHVLLHFPLELDDREEVEATVWYLIKNRFKQGGNYPSCQNNSRDTLIQWSHGAAGTAVMLCKAAQVYAKEKKGDDFSVKALKFHDVAMEAGEVVWRRGLNQKIGLADGIAGNAHTFLSPYRLTADRLYLNRAEAFAAALHEKVKKMMPLDCTSDEELNVSSLFHGLAGVACLFLDITSPENSRFPGYEL